MLGRIPKTRLFWLLLVLALPQLLFAAPTDAEIQSTYAKIIAKVNLDRLRKDYAAIGAIGSRVAGSSGERRTFDYVKHQFQAMGLSNITFDSFPIAVPDPSAIGTLTVGGTQVPVYPLWPNLVRTSTCDVRGKLIYGKSGSLEDLRGKDLRGNIAVLEMGEGATWKNAAKLGAAAVIFIQPDDVTRGDVETKFSAAPLDVPRFYLPLKVAGPVLDAALNSGEASLKCQQKWLHTTSGNLIAELPGTDPSKKDEPIEVFAFADSMSIVPGIAPGAEAIGGIAGLLETARVTATIDHARPLRFILSGAHFLALQGSREYVNHLMETDAPARLLTITLDLSSGNSGIGSYGRGWFYEFRDEGEAHVQNVSRIFRNHTDKLAPVMGVSAPRLVLVDAANDSDSRTWKNNVPGKFALDCEPMVNAGMNALTFMTVEDSRQRVDTPFDTLDQVNVANVRRQVQTLNVMLYHALNDTTSKRELSDYRIPLSPAKPQGMRLVGGFSNLTGDVVEYDAQKSFVPDIPVPYSLAAALGRQKTFMGVRGDIIAPVGKDGHYKIIGVAPTTSFPWTDRHHTTVGAYHVNDATGAIDYAPSMGFHGDFSYPLDFNLTTSQRESPIVVFKCVSVNMFDLVDPQDLKALDWIRVLDQATMTKPGDYGEFSPPMDARMNAEIEDSQILFFTPGQRFILLGGTLKGDTRLILANTKPGDDKGIGYQAPGAEPIGGRADVALNGTFYDVALNTAKDIYAINETRLQKFKKYRIISPAIQRLHDDCGAEIKLADQAYANREWPSAERHARAAWGFALRAHPTIMSTANDVVNGVVFYLFLLIPFSYFLERLLIGNQLLTKQLAWAISFFVGSFVLLRLIHPAFEIVSNPMMIFVAFVMGSLSLIVISFILGKFEASLKAVRQQQSGVHEVDIKRSSVAMAAFNLGVSNMRRRKARTILTTLTLVVMTFIVLSFTSIVQELSLNEFGSNTEARYSGILIRNPGLDPMQGILYRQIANEFSGRANVVRRATYYGADIGDTGVLTLKRADRVAEVRTMVGFEPGETKVLRLQDALLPGGRWFEPGERNVMILPQPLAQQLKVEPKDVGTAKVTYAGIEYTVIGILDPGILRGIVDLDGDNIMPADFSLSRRLQEDNASSNQAFRSFIRLDPATSFFVPTETALALGADLRTIAISFDSPEATKKALDELMPRLRMNLYGSVPEQGHLAVKQFSVLESAQSSGIGLILIQLIIAAVFVLNTMIASVYERTKEIGIFSSIGLAPNHIAMLFFAESLVYGILGAVIGYFVAQGTAKIIVATGALPGLTLNFSSTSAVLSAMIVMGVVLLSTIYPARKASQIAAPAMNDEVFQTAPEGDVWELPLPFSISATEARPLVNFLGEWFCAYEEYTIGDFVTSGTVVEQNQKDYIVATTAWLAPYDLGVSQYLRLTAAPSPIPGVYTLTLVLTRQSGDPENWPIVNQRFLANLRKQFLTWRTIGREERTKYEVEPGSNLRKGPAAPAPPSEVA